MTIQKRSFPIYVLLNCLTLGIYGAVTSAKMGKEINALCEGDGEEPRFGYFGAVLLHGISPLLGLVTGLIVGLINQSAINIFGFGLLGGSSLGEMKAITVFSAMLAGMVTFTVIGGFVSGMYLKYWWYKQSNRLKYNAHRYGLTVKESGTDTFLFRTAFELLLFPVTSLLLFFTLLIPAIIVFLCLLGSELAAIIFAFIFALPFMLFIWELSAGAYSSIYIIIKNLNRFADVIQSGAETKPFDPMGYTYYPSAENHYPKALAKVLSIQRFSAEHESNGNSLSETKSIQTVGTLIGEKGSCAGYVYDLITGEEIVIGKDARMSSVVIDTAYKEISRKHVGVTYSAEHDQYCVVDYSSNGTWADGRKLVGGQPTYLPHGTELRLANDKNIFRLN